jgi:hypothetical protein
MAVFRMFVGIEWVALGAGCQMSDPITCFPICTFLFIVFVCILLIDHFVATRNPYGLLHCSQGAMIALRAWAPPPSRKCRTTPLPSLRLSTA